MEDYEVINNDVEVITDVEVIENNALKASDEESAKQLTEDIKSTTTALYILLKRAHDTKAWLTLGYKSWTEYIEQEFDFSRARSYQLINQANVIEEINQASGVPLYITERDARSIKKRLPEITKRLEEVKDSDFDDDKLKDEAERIIEEEKEDIDNSNEYSGKDENGFSVGGEEEVDFEETEVTTYDNNEPTSFPPKIITFYENVNASFEVFERASPIATDIGKYIKSTSDVDNDEFVKLAKGSIAMITTILREIEKGAK